MAAKLKKRALAEFSHVIQEEARPLKQLRLVSRPSQSEPSLSLHGGSSGQECLQALVVLERQFPLSQASAERVFPQLMETLGQSRLTLVRCKVLDVLNRLATTPGFNPQVISDQLLPKLTTEESHKVTSNMLTVLTTIGCCLPNSLTFHQHLVTSVHKLLKNSNHLVRGRCLELIGELGSCDEKTKDLTSPDNIFHILGQYTSDDDPRVRSVAFIAILSLYERGQALSQNIYTHACCGLGDDNEDVRRRAAKLVWVLSRLYPESPVTCGGERREDGGEELRLVDDGFAKICNLMNDISVTVRVEAAALLGSLHQVSARFLEQTLDKKLMSNMKRKVSAHDRAKEHFASGEWSTGAQWADDKPREDLDAQSISLMNIGACGAFVHGLEDEFLEVRNAALDSLCELAVQSPRFAVLSQDSIIDMVNDEIESVRLNAIHSLRKLSRHLTLRDDQLDNVLGVLQDFSYTTREALRGLLGEMPMATWESVNSTIMALLDNLRRYPEDRTCIWSCSQKLGRRHSRLTLMLAEELLCLHPFFHSPEPDMEDPAYVTVLLAVFNAAALCPTMVALFPEHTRRHYTYLRSSLPHLLPPIQALEDAGSQMGQTLVSKATTGTADFLRQLLSKLSGLSSLDLDSAEQLLSICVRDLERVEALDERLSESTECTCLFLSSQLMLTRLMRDAVRSDVVKVYQESVVASVDKILQQTTQLQTLYVGVGGELAALARQTEVKAVAVQLLFCLERASLVEKVRASTVFQQFLGLVKSSVDSDPSSYDSFTRQVVSLYDTLDWSRLQALPGMLRQLSQLLQPATLLAPCDVRKMTATIHEPPPTSETPIKFPAGLAATVTMVATVHNVSETGRVSILVRYPDQHTQFVTPPLTAWTRVGPLRHRLVAPVLLSHGLWSESCHVELSLVIEACGEGRQLLKLQENVPLTKPVKVLVSPKPFKR